MAKKQYEQDILKQDEGQKDSGIDSIHDMDGNPPRITEESLYRVQTLFLKLATNTGIYAAVCDLNKWNDETQITEQEYNTQINKYLNSSVKGQSQ